MNTITIPPDPPKLTSKDGLLVIEKGIISNGNAYDILIGFEGKERLPDVGSLPQLRAKEIQNLAYEILSSLHASDSDEYKTVSLEQLAFKVEKEADDPELKTAILVGKAANPVFQSWRDKKVENFKVITETRGIGINWAAVSEKGESRGKLSNVHDGLICFRGWFHTDSILAMPKRKVLPASTPLTSSTPLRNPLWLPKKKQNPQYTLFVHHDKNQRKAELNRVWKSFKDQHPEFIGISLDVLLGLAEPSDENKRQALHYDLFKSEKKNELFNAFDDSALKIFQPLFTGEIAKRTLKTQFLNELESYWS